MVVPIGTPIWLVYNGQSIYNNAQSITIHPHMDDLGGIPFLGNLYIFELCYARKKKARRTIRSSTMASSMIVP